MKTQFHRVFDSLDYQEKKRFEDYLRSPYCNANPRLLSVLYAELSGMHMFESPEPMVGDTFNWEELSDVQRRLLRS